MQSEINICYRHADSKPMEPAWQSKLRLLCLVFEWPLAWLALTILVPLLILL